MICEKSASRGLSGGIASGFLVEVRGIPCPRVRGTGEPQTLYRMTEIGRQALTDYVQALKQLLGEAINA